MRPKIDLKSAVASAPAYLPVAITFDELVRAYGASKFNDSYTRLRKWVDLFAGRSAWEIPAAEIQTAADAMVEHGYKGSTVNRDTSLIGQVYRWAKLRRMAPPKFTSPTLELNRYPELPRVVSLSDDEVKQLLDASLGYKDRRFGAFVHILHCSGCRKSEILNRRWADVDLDNSRILASTTKTGRPRYLHLDPETVTLMRRAFARHRKEPDDFVFEGRAKGTPITFKNSWLTLVARIGRPDLHMHDMRHHRAKELLRKGVTVAVAAQVLGHSSNILQTRYGHLETAHLEAAIQTSWAA